AASPAGRSTPVALAPLHAVRRPGRDAAQSAHEPEGQGEHSSEVAQRVVAMTGEDLLKLRELVDGSSTRTVSLRTGGAAVTSERALAEAQRIRGVREAYRDRAASETQQLAMLQGQRDRLQEILDKLQGEHRRFEARVWQLDQQIDAIARNDRLIELTKQQQEILAEYDRFGKVGNLDQLEGRLAQLRAEQEARLETLSKGRAGDYEAAAEDHLAGEKSGLWDPFEDLDLDDSRDDHRETDDLVRRSEGRPIAAR
ncbi:MAG: hypothetical protein ACO4CI_11070, partial [Phycisphaerales bacterium]